ncbi:hypothetical protein BpHYR1_040760 [Brachionus plicatilis]|uniref:Uncharacterized protein n=1 Tax=Brachionus plicatilis TaxID=10195 RepID=A0A3M7PSK9_BRAPC|nr:hypothetical protein BpHYR1_040760 [Brachionus plicatilis]
MFVPMPNMAHRANMSAKARDKQLLYKELSCTNEPKLTNAMRGSGVLWRVGQMALCRVPYSVVVEEKGEQEARLKHKKNTEDNEDCQKMAGVADGVFVVGHCGDYK